MTATASNHSQLGPQSDPDGFPTLYAIAQNIIMPGSDGKAHKASPRITDGLVPIRPQLKPDRIYWLGPSELGGIFLPVSPTGLGGRQRDPSSGQGPRHVRKLARLITEGRPLPSVAVALHDRRAYYMDGGHRACAGMMARLPVRVETRNTTPEDQQFLFYGQSGALKIHRDRFVLDGNSPIDLYVQDALTTDDHPWSGLVAIRAAHLRQGPGAVALLLAQYGCNVVTNTFRDVDQSRFEPELGDELALMLWAFGTHKSNPLAFTNKALRASTLAAVYAVRRSPHRQRDFRRWRSHMPLFRFSDYAHIRSYVELCDYLLAHWNKRLSPSRKVTRT